MSWYGSADNDSLNRYAEHLRSTVDWATAEWVQWPNWSDERRTLYAVAEEMGVTLKVRKGKAYIVRAEG